MYHYPYQKMERVVLSKFRIFIGFGLLNVGSSWNYKGPLTYLVLFIYYLTLAMSSDRYKLSSNYSVWFQVSEGVPSGAVPAVPAAQVPAAPALHLLQLALPEPEAAQASAQARRHFQLQCRQLLWKVWWDHRYLSHRRWVSTHFFFISKCYS